MGLGCPKQVLDICLCRALPANGSSRGRCIQNHIHGPLPLPHHHISGITFIAFIAYLINSITIYFRQRSNSLTQCKNPKQKKSYFIFISDRLSN